MQGKGGGVPPYKNIVHAWSPSKHISRVCLSACARVEMLSVVENFSTDHIGVIRRHLLWYDGERGFRTRGNLISWMLWHDHCSDERLVLCCYDLF
jgi:hypothetical protein